MAKETLTESRCEECGLPFWLCTMIAETSIRDNLGNQPEQRRYLKMYHKSMEKYVGQLAAESYEKGRREGYAELSKEELEFIKHSLEFLGLNSASEVEEKEVYCLLKKLSKLRVGIGLHRNHKKVLDKLTEERDGERTE